MNFVIRFLGLLAIVVVIGMAAFMVVRDRTFAGSVPLAPREPRLPDLVSLPLTDLLVATDQVGNEFLRFSSSIANLGDGPLLIRAERPFSWSEQWRVEQLFQESNGGTSGRITGANLVLGGHGHEHWHLEFGASYVLAGEDGDRIASKTKAGFCFFDQVLHAPSLDSAPTQGRFENDSCGKDGALAIQMGMSVGWSDPYFWQLEDQSVVITGQPDGRYRLEAIADPDGWLVETDEGNNGTWVVFELGTQPDGLRTAAVVETAEAP
jgi:hypothetical protein